MANSFKLLNISCPSSQYRCNVYETATISWVLVLMFLFIRGFLKLHLEVARPLVVRIIGISV